MGDEDEVLQIESIRQVREIFRQFKVMVKEKEATLVEARDMMSRGGGHKTGLDGVTSGMSDLMADEENRTGTVEAGRGFAVGKADPGARPATMDSGARKDEAYGEEDATSIGAGSPIAAKHATFGDFDDAEPPPLDRNEAYTLYRRQQGAGLNSTLNSYTKPLKELKVKSAAAAKKLNELTKVMDKNKALLEQKTEVRKIEMEGVEGGEDIVDEEEFAMMMALKTNRKEYKELHSQFKSDTAQKKQLMAQVQEAKVALVDAFNDWYNSARPTTGMQQPEQHDEGDVLDDGEMFEQMEVTRVMDQDPDSLAFFQAQKKMKSTANHDRTSNMRKQKLKRNQ